MEKSLLKSFQAASPGNWILKHNVFHPGAEINPHKMTGTCQKWQPRRLDVSLSYANRQHCLLNKHRIDEKTLINTFTGLIYFYPLILSIHVLSHRHFPRHSTSFEMEKHLIKSSPVMFDKYYLVGPIFY